MAASKYHVTKAGIKPCNATKRACRYGSEVHFENREQAKEYFETMMAKEEGTTKSLRKTTKNSKASTESKAPTPPPRTPSKPTEADNAKNYASFVAYRWTQDPEAVEENFGQRFSTVAEAKAAARQEYLDMGVGATYHQDFDALGDRSSALSRSSLEDSYDPRNTEGHTPSPVRISTTYDTQVEAAQEASDQAKEEYYNARDFAREFSFASQEEKREAMAETNALFEIYRQRQDAVEEALKARREALEKDKKSGYSTAPLTVETGAYTLSLQEVPTGSSSQITLSQNPQHKYTPQLRLDHPVGEDTYKFTVTPRMVGSVDSQEAHRASAHLRQGAETARILQSSFNGPLGSRKEGTAAFDEEKLKALPTGMPVVEKDNIFNLEATSVKNATKKTADGQTIRVTTVSVEGESFKVGVYKNKEGEVQMRFASEAKNSRVHFNNGRVQVRVPTSDALGPDEAYRWADMIDHDASVATTLNHFIERFKKDEA